MNSHKDARFRLDLAKGYLARAESDAPAKKWDSQRLISALDDFRNMGLKTHVRATYGDESTRTPPWELIQEREAREGLTKARRATALAEMILAEMTRTNEATTSEDKES